MKKTIIIVAVLALIAATGFANAQHMGRGMGPGMMGGYGMGPGYGYGQDYGAGDYGYGLTEEQAKEYREIYDKYAKDIYSLNSQLASKMERLNALYWSGKVKKSDTESLVEDINKLRSELFTKYNEMKSELAEKDLPPSLNCPGDGPCSAYGMGRGMMGPGYGMGPGMMQGPGYGMGPGMMYGPGYGYGMGPGMMYGPGYGY